MRRTRNKASTAGGGEHPLAAATGEQAWVEVIRKMDEVYHELLDYETALEEKNAALEESQQFIFSVLTSISDILVVCNRSGIIEDLNPSMLKLTGRDMTDLRGSSLLDLFADETSRERMRAHLTEHSGDQLADCELLLRGADGQPVPVALSCTPRLTGAGRRLGLVVTGRPVGELRKAYLALRQAHDELKRTQQQLLHAEKMASLGRLVAGVAHELNNPLSFVLGNVAVLRRYQDRIMKYLGAVHDGTPPQALRALRSSLGIDVLLADLPSLIDGTMEGAQRTREVVEGLLRFSAPGTDVQQPVDLVPIIERSVHWVAKAAPEQFIVNMELPASMPVNGNPGHLQQVMMNLVQNAVDATAGEKPGTLTITASVRDGQVITQFADNGPGIAPENLPRLFDPFFTTKPVGKGTGLGLSISYGIIERHGGTLAAVNGTRRGAVFTLALPLRAGGAH